MLLLVSILLILKKLKSFSREYIVKKFDPPIFLSSLSVIPDIQILILKIFVVKFHYSHVTIHILGAFKN